MELLNRQSSKQYQFYRFREASEGEEQKNRQDTGKAALLKYHEVSAAIHLPADDENGFGLNTRGEWHNRLQVCMWLGQPAREEHNGKAGTGPSTA